MDPEFGGQVDGAQGESRYRRAAGQLPECSVRPVVVLGAGTMGRGIAQVALAAEHAVALIDRSDQQLTRAAAEIEQRLTKDGRWTPRLVSQFQTHTSIDCIRGFDGPLVIEAIVEDLGAKQAIARAAQTQFGAEAIFASNTSSFSISAIAAAVPHPARVIGLHFFNPVPVMRLVEVVPGIESDPEVVDEARTTVGSWGKSTIQARSTPGFIVNRVARPFYGESLLLAEEHTTDIATLDRLLRESAAFRMGPFQLMDLVGNDVNESVTRSVWEAHHFDDRFIPSVLQRELVTSGRLGRKSGRGWYDYDNTSAAPAPAPRASIDPSKRESSEQALTALMTRLGIETGTPTPTGRHLLAADGLGAFVLTRGRTAEEESHGLNMPVVVFDRPLDVTATPTVAYAASTTARRLAAHVAAVAADTPLQVIEIRDVPGLVAARVACMIINEATETVHQAVCSADDVNTAMRLGTNYPLGPIEWKQRWGPRYVESVLDGLHANYKRPRYRASLALRKNDDQSNAYRQTRASYDLRAGYLSHGGSRPPRTTATSTSTPIRRLMSRCIF